ncbi:alpha/beta hydrolase [Nocardioides albidus]|uniref:Alpha/beta hydrolase n=1 Tax=Nocardioides albidus TaxID=1517589 RepID=A0A5C4VKX3_9ACTN|nr:alpha/beta hydrolase [Nocardioides albidus]TNM36490.1 alpha/beta hydrolase [Nocardioides albidus]
MSETNRGTPTFRRPDELLWRTEPMRATGDLLALWASLPTLAPLRLGDGHTVLVLPGFLADDLSTIALRTLLKAHNYRAARWKLGTNLGPTEQTWGGAIRRLERLHERSGKPVTLIGQSLGGIFARELARRHPEQVRQVITLGSPYRLRSTEAPETTTVGHLYHSLRGLHTDAFDHTEPEEGRPPITVPTTSIYSRSDGVVPWQSCVDVERPLAENVEVTASHCGMGFHPQVLRIVLDRLAQEPGRWAPYAEAHPIAS